MRSIIRLIPVAILCFVWMNGELIFSQAADNPFLKSVYSFTIIGHCSGEGQEEEEYRYAELNSQGMVVFLKKTTTYQALTKGDGTIAAQEVLKTGDEGFTELKPRPKINDQGLISFVGKRNSKQGVYVRDVQTNNQLCAEAGTNNYVSFGNPSINNHQPQYHVAFLANTTDQKQKIVLWKNGQSVELLTTGNVTYNYEQFSDAVVNDNGLVVFPARPPGFTDKWAIVAIKVNPETLQTECIWEVVGPNQISERNFDVNENNLVDSRGGVDVNNLGIVTFGGTQQSGPEGVFATNVYCPHPVTRIAHSGQDVGGYITYKELSNRAPAPDINNWGSVAFRGTFNYPNYPDTRAGVLSFPNLYPVAYRGWPSGGPPFTPNYLVIDGKHFLPQDIWVSAINDRGQIPFWVGGNFDGTSDRGNFILRADPNR